MGLASAMSTALTGLNASETQIGVIGNNLANSNTVGFKASDVLFANQFLQTQSVGSAPTASNGGTNPQQQGLGVMVAQITPNFSQGTISTANSPTDLAIQGDGFFIVQGQNGQQNYTRNGTFTTNAQNQLVTGTGNRVMGYGIDNKFVIDTSHLQALTIPLGTAMVAKATTVATLQGSLTPIGAIANTAAITQTNVLTDGSLTFPGESKTRPGNGMTATAAGSGTGLAAGTYDYYVTFTNGSVESQPQPLAAIVTLNSSGDVTLSNLPTDTSGDWTGMTIYRSVNIPNNTSFYALPNATRIPLTTTTVTDSTADATLVTGTVLNKNGAHINGPTADVTLDVNQTPISGNLTGTYKYYVTYFNATTLTESRPQLVASTTPALSNNQVTLSDFPIDTSGKWTSERIYRSTNDQPGDTKLYQIGEVPMTTLTDPTKPNYTYADNATDTSIRTGANLVPPGQHTLDFNGPPVTSSTLLTNVVEYDSSTGTYQNVFPTTGTLHFTGSKGGNSLASQALTITNTTSLKELATFLQGSLGIQSPPGNDPNHEIRVDSVSGLPAGVTIKDGRIQIVSNDGTAEAVSIPLSALQLTSGNPPATNSVSLPFNSIQAASGQGTMASMVAYDSLGMPLSVNITAVLEDRSSLGTVYRWYADCGQNDPGKDVTNIAVGTGTVSFDGQGNVQAVSASTVSIGRANEPSVNPLIFNLDFSQVTGLASPTASLSVANQDGAAPGVLNSFNISNSGLISGVFSNGISQNLGQIRLARFSNPVGLEQMGQNMYATGVNSGLPIMGNPGAQGTGTIVAGSLELSNTDVGASLINLITSSTMYQSNTRVITTATQLFDSLLQLGR